MKTPPITHLMETHRLLRGIVVGVAFCAMASGLSACGSVAAAHDPHPAPRSPSVSAVLDGRYDRDVTVGELQISPPPTEVTTKNLGLTWPQATKLFEATSAVQGSHAQAIFGYGLVTLGNSKAPPGTPPLDHRGAWVGIAWGGVANCPAVIPPKSSSSTKTSYRPIYTAVVIYGQGGSGAVVYTSRGTPPCGGPLIGPKIAPAREVLSVPWQPASVPRGGSAPVTYQAPSCSKLFSTIGDGNLRSDLFKIGVEVTVPFDYVKCGITTGRTDVFLAPPSTTPTAPAVPLHPILTHAPTGLVRVLEAGDFSGSGSHASPTSSSPLPNG
ncbi:hypothetical protein [Ferrimicrobium sp.]|uniref:hypothetical protein n=1 Tax=Ferrimicrobium sp. TaxID=2926050 RepID=UPI00260DC1F9|nr:hypothetical protein [Ferrimicrobium sp.]